MPCPTCNSDRIRRGGRVTWSIYVALIALAIVAVLIVHLHAGLIAGVMIAVVVLTHLLVGERVCLDCGTQWRSSEETKK
jgi:hypothetical protein